MPLRLVAPIVELGPHGAPVKASSWRPMDSGGWCATAGPVRLEVTVAAPAAGDDDERLTFSATVDEPTAVRRCVVVAELPYIGRPWFLDRSLHWRALDGTVVLPESTPFVLRWRRPDGTGAELRALCGFPPMRLSARRAIVLEVVLDASALHPRWSFRDGQAVSKSAPERGAGWSSAVTLSLRAVRESAAAPVVPARFPHGAEAAFTITDHPDFDTEDTLRAFLDGSDGRKGWLDRGLRFTKSVFAIESGSMARPPAPTLERESYGHLVERLHRDGSEIAPHGVHESGPLSADRFRAALAGLVDRFRPRTWIDHGLSLPYCYSMGGATDPQYQLLAELRKSGITTLWAYHDVPCNAAASLNLAAPRAHDIGVILSRSGRHAARREMLTAAHYVRSAVLARTSGKLAYVLGRSLSGGRRAYLLRSTPNSRRGWAIWSAAGIALLGLVDAAWGAQMGGALPGGNWSRAESAEWGTTIYPERADPLHLVSDTDFLLFATLEVLHIGDVYGEAALSTLIAERGLHIGHTYLLNRLPYVDGLFERGSAAPRLTRAWLAVLDILQTEVAAGRLWNPPMGELAEWTRSVQRVTVHPVSDDTIEVRHPGDEALRGFTLLLPPHVSPADVEWNGAPPAGTRAWGDWLAVWGDVPARGCVHVRWGARSRAAVAPAGVLHNDPVHARDVVPPSPAVREAASDTPVVLVFWDYDTQWGADRSRNPRGSSDWGHLEFPRTEWLLDAHARFDVPACFAVVGAAALPGDRPYHDPEQVRRMHDAGHEIASHSFCHEWLPGLPPAALRDTLRASKDALEQCIGAEVSSFVPPFNQPFDYARAWSFSLSERLSVSRDRADVGRLCTMLQETGYRFCRLAYRSLVERAAELASRHPVRQPEHLHEIGGVQCLRLNTPGGFAADVRDAIGARLRRGGYWILYGHPHSVGDEPGPQSRAAVEAFLATVARWRHDGAVRVARPRDVLAGVVTV